MLTELKGQTVLVVGGSAGIGLETARRARAEGARVILTGRNVAALEQARREVGADGIAAFDAQDARAVEAFFSSLSRPVHHVMTTAGRPRYLSALSAPLAEVRDGLSTHLMLCIAIARYAAPKMAPEGSLTFMGGTGARKPGIGNAVVASATAGLTALVANLALELQPIRVNLIAAGFVDTRLSASILGEQLSQRKAELKTTLPIRRVVEPQDVASLAVHLMINTALTGAAYDVDGGQQLL